VKQWEISLPPGEFPITRFGVADCAPHSTRA